MTDHRALPSGWYWVRIEDGDAEYQAAYYDAGEFWLVGVQESFRIMAEVGPEIIPPAP